MKLTPQQLRSIIREELQKSLNESTDPSRYIAPETLRETEELLMNLRIEFLTALREESPMGPTHDDPSYDDALDMEATNLTRSLVLDILDRKFGGGPAY